MSAINVHGALAVGVSGESAGLIEASPRIPRSGFVRRGRAVNPASSSACSPQDLIPVIATIGSDADGQAYNINADTVAGAIAESLGAEKLVYLTDIEGIRRDEKRPGHPDPPDHRDRARRAHRRRHAHRRDDPEDRVCVHAVRNGVGRAHILDGRIPHVLLLEIFTDEGIGTMVLPEIRP